MTISYDDVPRAQIRVRLAGRDRRTVTDPTRRHAAVAVVPADFEVGEDRVHTAPVDDWIRGRPLPEEALDGQLIDVREVRHSCCAAQHPV